jgi:hypothetical protein
MKKKISKDFPKFRAPPKEVKQADGTCYRLLLAHALINEGKKFEPTPEYDQASKIFHAEWLSRVSVLFEYYGIDSKAPDAWRLLADRLAGEFISKFSISRGTSLGRHPLDWAIPTAFVTQVDKVSAEKGITKKAAIHQVAKKTEPWKSQKKDWEAAYYRWSRLRG